MATTRQPPVVEFYYDIVCPFAYIASLRISSIALHTGSTIHWRPVLLGGIYRATQAQQGAHGSASDVANPAKRAYGSRNFTRACKRLGVPINWPTQGNHPVRSVQALRLLYALPDGNGRGGAFRGAREVVSHALYKVYWVENRSKEVLGSEAALLRVAKDALFAYLDSDKNSGSHELGLTKDEIESFLVPDIFNDSTAKKALEENTANAVAHGAPGVPGFWVPAAKRFYWGQDRMHFLHATLLQLSATYQPPNKPLPRLPSLLPRCRPLKKLGAGQKVRLEFWYDFSSPWAYLGWSGLARLQRQFGEELEIVLRPLLLGVVFREIGSPMLPSTAVSRQKREWTTVDMRDWVQFWRGVDEQEGEKESEIMPEGLRWPDIFPIRSPNLLRVALVEEKTIPVLYRSCWILNKNMSDDNVLVQVLDEAGFDGKALLAKAKTPEIKQHLADNTKEAIDAGFCGVPTYRVFRRDEEAGRKSSRNQVWKQFGGFVWGQDETGLVQDLISGWDEEGKSGETAKIEAIEVTERARI